jgi:hypothetical protein
MQIFRTGHDVRAYARSHDEIPLKDQRTKDSETVRSIIRNYSGNYIFLQRTAAVIRHLHRQLNVESDGELISAQSVANQLDGTVDPWPGNAQREHMAAALIRLCTRRHASFDRLFCGESRLPHHVAEILRDLPFDGDELDEFHLERRPVGLVGRDAGMSQESLRGLAAAALLLERLTRLPGDRSVSHPGRNYEILQTPKAFAAPGLEKKAGDGLSGLAGPEKSSMNEGISEALNYGMTAFSDLITSFGETEKGQRDVINCFLSEIYLREAREFSGLLNNEDRIEYLKEIGSIAKDAGLDMREADANGVLVPKAQGSEVFRTFVGASCKFIEDEFTNARLNDMKPEIERRVHQEGLRLIAPMTKALGYPDPATFHDRLRAAASRFARPANN